MRTSRFFPLIQEGCLERTPKGRVATPLAVERMGLPPVALSRQGELPLR